MAGRDKAKVTRKGAAVRSEGTATSTRSLSHYALQLQAGAGNRATARALARVHYPYLRAVELTHYTGESQSAAGLAGALPPKLDALKAVYTQISNKRGEQVVTLTAAKQDGSPLVPGLTPIAGLSGLGGPWDQATKRATATVREWYQLLSRWRDVLNDEYFTPPPGPRPPSFPGKLPYNFNYTAQHRQWIVEQFTARGVRRDSDAERAASTVAVQSGRLVRATGRRVDTKDSVTWFKGLGWEIFVLAHTGELHMASHLVGRRHHSSLLGLHAATVATGTGARDAASAGEMLVRDGKIEQLSTKTGHYQSGENQLRQIVHMLVKRGADLSGTKLLDFAGNVLSPDARTWWTTIGQGAYETRKTDYVIGWYAREYSWAAIHTAFHDMLGWNFVPVGGQWMWLKPDGAYAGAKDVRKALKATFPRRAEPEATYGAANTPVAVSL